MQSHHFTLIVEGPDIQDEAMIDSLFKMAVMMEQLVGQRTFNLLSSIAKRRVLSRRCSRLSTTFSVLLD